MKRVLKTIAALLAVLLLMAGCQTTDTTWAYSYNGESMPAGLYISYMLTSYSEAVDKLYQEEQEALAASESSETGNSVMEMELKDVLKMELEGMTVSDWITANTQKLAKRYFAVRGKMAEADVVLSQAEIDAANSSARKSMDTYKALYTSNGIAESSLSLSIQGELAKERLFLALYGEGGELEVPAAEIEDYFSTKYAKMQHMYFTKPTIYDLEADENDPEGTKDEERLAALQAEMKATVQDYFDRFEAGASIEELVAQREKETSEDPDAVVQYDAGSLDFIISQDDVAYVGETMMEGVFAAKPGDYLLLEDENYYYLVHVLDILEDPEDLATYKNDLLYELKFEEHYLPMLDELASTLELTANQNSLNRYLPSKIKM